MTNEKVIFILLLSLFSVGCANQKIKPASKHQKIKPASKCAEKGENVNVQARALKNASLTYQIELAFSALMDGHYSFFPLRDTKVMKVFWKDNHFNIVVKTESDVNSLSLVINPQSHYKNGFMTKCGSMLPTQEISAKVK